MDLIVITFWTVAAALADILFRKSAEFWDIRSRIAACLYFLCSIPAWYVFHRLSFITTIAVFNAVSFIVSALVSEFYFKESLSGVRLFILLFAGLAIALSFFDR